MSTIIILLCLVNFAVSLQITSQNPSVDVLKGGSGQLKWDISKATGETYHQSSMEFDPSSKIPKTVAVFREEYNVQIGSLYSGRGWTSTWDKNTNAVTLNVQNVDSNDDGFYRLRLVYFTASNKDVTDILDIRLNVLVKPHFPDKSYYTDGSQAFNEGTKVTLKCEPEGSPKPIDIDWEKNGVKIWTTTTDNPNLVFDNLTRNDAGTYVCKARSKAGSADFRPTTQLTVKHKPVNTKFNTTDVLLNGKTVDLQCSADADPEAKFRIFGGGIAEVAASKTGKVKLKVDLSRDGNIVSCTPHNSLGNGPTVLFKIDVQVIPKILPGLPERADAIEGRNYSVSCSAYGKPAPEIIWLKDGSPLRKMPPSYIVGKRPDNTFESKSRLTMGPVRREDNGKYGCQAKNKHGSNIDYVILNLLYLPSVKRILVDNKEFTGDFVVRAGLNVQLKCEAEGNPPPTYYVWRWENGTVIQNRTTGDLKFENIQPEEGGRLSCAGNSYIGEGKKRHINVLVRVPPRIIVSPPRTVYLNESNRLQLFCNATGVPEPTIHWKKTDDPTFRATGERLSLPEVKYSQRGIYTCTADNGIEPNVTRRTDVIIYFRPRIVTKSPTDTQFGAESGEVIDLVCVAEANPEAKLKWFSYPSMQELNTSLPDIISIVNSNAKTLTMRVNARIGVKYLCYAYNNRGNDTQIYAIRPKGKPEAPVLTYVKTYINNVPNQLSTVRAHLQWTPGYNGGQTVRYKVYYGPHSSQKQISTDIDDRCNCLRSDECRCLTITDNLEANTDYVFYVQAENNDGPSNNYSNIVSRRTEAFYGSASVERLQPDGKTIKVSFDIIYTKANLTKQVRYRAKERRRKKEDEKVWDTRNPEDKEATFLAIDDLDVEKHYLFQVSWTVKLGNNKITQITSAGEVTQWNPGRDTGAKSNDGLSKEEIIAVIAGVGGFLLIVILVLFLCLIRRRQKPKRDETVIVMRRPPQNEYVVTRRSLIGSVEDDPFESAHYGTQEKKNKARDSYYLPDSEDMNTFTPDNNTASRDNTAKRVNPAENSQAYQPYTFGGQKSQYHDDDDQSSSDNDSYGYKGGKQRPSDDELSSEPGYARIGDDGKLARDNVDGPRSRPDPNDVYAKVNKGNNNNHPKPNGRGAPPPYRPRSTADSPLPPYPDDQLDLDDPSAVPYDDPLPPPMPVLSSSHPHSVPDGIWNDRSSNVPRGSVDTTMERHKSPSRTSLGSGKPYINAQGKLVRPGSSRFSSSENFEDPEQRSPEPEVPAGRSRHMNLDDDESNLVSYLV